MKTIWIVDDDEEMTHSLQLMLRLVECEALGFPDARTTAQALLAGKRPDLMLLDINMPDVSGLDLLEFLRRRKEWKDLFRMGRRSPGGGNSSHQPGNPADALPD